MPATAALWAASKESVTIVNTSETTNPDDDHGSEDDDTVPSHWFGGGSPNRVSNAGLAATAARSKRRRITGLGVFLAVVVAIIVVSVGLAVMLAAGAEPSRSNTAAFVG